MWLRYFTKILLLILTLPLASYAVSEVDNAMPMSSHLDIIPQARHLHYMQLRNERKKRKNENKEDKSEEKTKKKKIEETNCRSPRHPMWQTLKNNEPEKKCLGWVYVCVFS